MQDPGWATPPAGPLLGGQPCLPYLPRRQSGTYPRWIPSLDIFVLALFLLPDYKPLKIKTVFQVSEHL